VRICRAAQKITAPLSQNANKNPQTAEFQFKQWLKANLTGQPEREKAFISQKMNAFS